MGKRHGARKNKETTKKRTDYIPFEFDLFWESVDRKQIFRNEISNYQFTSPVFTVDDQSLIREGRFITSAYYLCEMLLLFHSGRCVKKSLFVAPS